MVSLHVIGSPRRLARARAVFSGCDVAAVYRPLDPSTALGLMLPDDGGLTVALWRPCAHPVADEALFAAGVPVLHAWWDTVQAEVGPFVAHGATACPRCHRGCVVSPPAPPSSGDSPALATWALSWACLEALAYLRDGTSELIGSSWRWKRADPGLLSTAWTPTGGCRTPGCVSRNVTANGL